MIGTRKTTDAVTRERLRRDIRAIIVISENVI